MPTAKKPLLTKEQIANKYKVSLPSFNRYTRPDPSKRQKLGQSGGRKKLVSDENIKIVIDFAIPLIKSNDRQSVAKIVNKIVDVEQQLSEKHAKRFYHNTLKKHLNDLLEDTEQKNVANILYELATDTSANVGVTFLF